MHLDKAFSKSGELRPRRERLVMSGRGSQIFLRGVGIFQAKRKLFPLTCLLYEEQNLVLNGLHKGGGSVHPKI